MRDTRVTYLEKVYDYLIDNPRASNREISDDLRLDYNVIKSYVSRLKNKGLVGIHYDGKTRVCEIATEYPVSYARKPKSYKHEVYIELVESYREDFRECVTFDERLKVGREIRIILADM